MRKTIGIVGCSYSAGTSGSGYDSWVYELSKLHPNVNFINAARGGSSIQFAYHAFEQLFELENFKIDYTIFQITTPLRYTVYPHDFHVRDYLIQLTDNLWVYDDEKIKQNDFAFASAGWLNMKPEKFKTLSKFERKVLTHLTDNFIYTNNRSYILNYQGICEKVKISADFGYAHVSHHTLPKNINCMNHYINNFDTYVIDESNHVNQIGQQQIALQINDIFIKDLLK